LIVSVEVAAEPEGVTDPLENAQVEFAGSPEQLSITTDANPSIGVIVTVLVVEAPLTTVADAGDSATLKSAAVTTAVTVTVTALDIDVLNPAAPP
jgi:hypothetical protein